MSDLAENMRITRALIEHLRDENERLREQCDTHEMRANMAEEAAANLEAENDRLRGAAESDRLRIEQLRGLLREVAADDATAVGLESEIWEALGDSAVPDA